MKTVASKANSATVSTVVNDTGLAKPSVSVSVSATQGASTLVVKSESDTSRQFPSPSASAANAVTSGGGKRPVSLDLNKPKKQRLVPPTPLILDSSELQNSKTLNTPDLEKILLSSNLLQTPQPGMVFPTKVGPITSEQEAFGKGFEEALHSLHNSKNSQAHLSHNSGAANATTSVSPNVTNVAPTGGTGMSGGSFTYTHLENNNFPVAIKDEPQNPPASPPVSPIDMETQEKIKLERKRQRNRVAASKCRKRKLERITKLEEKVKILKGENCDLALVVKNLKDHVAQLKQQVIEHIETGCSIPTMYNGATLLQGK